MSSEDCANAFGWSDICPAACHHPYDHSHNFTLGKSIDKTCLGCGTMMKPDAQRFGNLFGANRAILDNFYECKQCKKIDTYVLYDGQSRGYDSIRVIALEKLKNDGKIF